MLNMTNLLDFISRYLYATWLGLIGPFQEAYAHRYLLLLLLKRDIVNRTSGTWLGDVWLLLQPALQLLGFWFLLDIILKIKFPHEVPFVHYFLLGMLPWLFMAEVLSRSLNVLREFSALYQRALFPMLILPLMPLILSALLYSVVMFLTVAMLKGIAQAWTGVLIIYLIAIWLIPWCYLLAIIGLFLRDVAQLFPFLITITMYLTPILYMPQLIPEPMQWILVVNPIADIVALIHALTQGLAWDWFNVIRPLGLWLLLLGPAWAIYHRAQPQIREML